MISMFGFLLIVWSMIAPTFSKNTPVVSMSFNPSSAKTARGSFSDSMIEGICEIMGDPFVPDGRVGFKIALYKRPRYVGLSTLGDD
ncbi:hypothetical protein BDV37DRAFT_242796 [Aspergillus pseudonomiae]|uniref:Uncharacterized protein n=1 Tax=Aspergillus pseudonomiae TaxID=1506151 RepID=A0A5N7DJC8_9EURO|nr:uncharacterized protein BDV37DRAFT_242796 [Aspergillus pseudonomiae]KAE8406556.1 hypothetical protein BDV37DRAFT_242796 [Aspergillus pseudonomiae]